MIFPSSKHQKYVCCSSFIEGKTRLQQARAKRNQRRGHCTSKDGRCLGEALGALQAIVVTLRVFAFWVEKQHLTSESIIQKRSHLIGGHGIGRPLFSQHAATRLSPASPKMMDTSCNGTPAAPIKQMGPCNVFWLELLYRFVASARLPATWETMAKPNTETLKIGFLSELLRILSVLRPACGLRS